MKKKPEIGFSTTSLKILDRAKRRGILSLDSVTERKPTTPDRAKRAGVDDRDKLSSREGVLVVQVQAIWMRARLGDQWVVAYRLVQQEGVPVVAEIRIYPEEERGPNQLVADPERGAGRWSAEYLGMKAKTPEGGLSSTLLRQVRMSEHLHYGAQIIAEFRRLWPDSTQFHPISRGFEQYTKRQRGRPSYPEDFYANFARDYVDATAKGSDRPVEDIAKKRKLKLSNVRTIIHRARAKGFLSETQQGSGGGQLTERGCKVLGLPFPYPRSRPRKRKKAV